MNIEDITLNSKATFLRYRHGMAYYALTVPYSEKLYSFPVPLSEIKDSVMVAENKTIYFMDYIHKAIQEGTLTKETI